MKHKATYAILATAILCGAGGTAFWFWQKSASSNQQYRTAAVERGDIIQNVRATGTVKPIKLVQVGTQVNGPIQKLYVDYNDWVKTGDLVAQIDPAIYDAKLAQDQANLQQNEANVDGQRAKLNQAEKELQRSQELASHDLLSQSDLDAAVANRDALAAGLKLAQASVEQSKAALRLSKANLDYTTIRSPVDGVIIGRNVDEGQTVVASMTAQTLFTIATDLRKVQIEASVPEADIGKITTNQPVTFTVDAHDQDFQGWVSQVRLGASTVQNVVTYPVIINADNPKEKLFPGMTANISCEVARRLGVLKVPNAALRFKPENQKNGTNGNGGSANGTNTPNRALSVVWIEGEEDQPPVPVKVQLGINDSSYTEILEPSELQAGQRVIVGFADPNAKSDNSTVNPFTPRFPQGRQQKR